MDITAINTMSWLNTGTTSTNLPAATLLTITNVTYRELINIITSRVNEDFFYDEWVVNPGSVSGRREYTLPTRTSEVAGLKKLINVGVKYHTTDTTFKSLEPTKFSNLVNDPTYYVENQPVSEPFFTVADKSVFIYPTPTETVTGGIILYGISDPKELTNTAEESDIKIPLDYHHLIVLGNEYKIYKTRKLKQEEATAYNYFVAECNRMVTELSDRIIRPLESQMPSLNQYE